MFNKLKLIKIARVIDGNFFTLPVAKSVVNYWCDGIFGFQVKGEFRLSADELIAFIRICKKLSIGEWWLHDGKLFLKAEPTLTDLRNPYPGINWTMREEK